VGNLWVIAHVREIEVDPVRRRTHHGLAETTFLAMQDCLSRQARRTHKHANRVVGPAARAGRAGQAGPDACVWRGWRAVPEAAGRRCIRWRAVCSVLVERGDAGPRAGVVPAGRTATAGASRDVAAVQQVPGDGALPAARGALLSP